MKTVTIFDTTLRDGELSDGVRFSTVDRITIASQLGASGVDVVEVAAFGASREQERVEVVRAIAANVRTCTLCVLAPSASGAIDAAGEALRGACAARIHVFQPTSRDAGAIAHAAAMVRRAKGFTSDVEFTPIDAACADLDALAAMVRAAIGGGATTINVADTAGRMLPEGVASRIREIHARVPEVAGVRVSFHGHDDLGLATANSLAAVRAGAGQIEVAVNGLGARAGNAALEEVVAAIAEHGASLDARTQVDGSRLAPLSRLVEERSGRVVAPQKAIVGRAAHWRPS